MYSSNFQPSSQGYMQTDSTKVQEYDIFQILGSIFESALRSTKVLLTYS